VSADDPAEPTSRLSRANSRQNASSPDYLDRTFGASRGVRLLPGRKLFWPEELPEVVAEEARRLWASAAAEVVAMSTRKGP